MTSTRITPPSRTIDRIAIVGGTHGNEWTGAYLVKKFERSPELVKRSSFTSTVILANPRAFTVGRRYVDKDLNRCFLRQDLQNDALDSYEEQRAKAIHQQLGPKGQPQVDVILDLHSTTANMALTLILGSYDPFNLQLAAYLSRINPRVRVYSWAAPQEEMPFLRTLSDLGICIEVGPVAQGVLDAALFQETETLVAVMLDYIDAYNQGTVAPEQSLTLYQSIAVIDYPRSARGEITAMIHPQRQFQDYQPLHPGEPLFLTFDGEAIAYEGSATVYPVFINEAAYYEKGMAMCLTEKLEMRLG